MYGELHEYYVKIMTFRKNGHDNGEGDFIRCLLEEETFGHTPPIMCLNIVMGERL